MKPLVKWGLIALACVVVFVGIYVLYDVLKENYDGESIATKEPVSQGQTGSGEGETKKHPAPNFTVYNEKGEEVKLSDFLGKPVVLNFWASWCYYCKEEMPDFDAAYKNHPEIQFLMINVTDGSSETVESARAYVESEGYSFPVVYDTTLEAASAYGASGLPMTVFIDREGNYVAYASGMLDAETLEYGLSMIK
ncbi:MAG: TlpA family protein disulfide reductase [Clostridia bacterium]|nr:TlpA family protein disulfide reductase [Clostridia bacterium]